MIGGSSVPLQSGPWSGEGGQRVVLKARAFPAQIFVGSVTAVAPAAVKEEERWRGKVVRVTTMIDMPNSGLTGSDQ